jgi:hypothetical protein
MCRCKTGENEAVADGSFDDSRVSGPQKLFFFPHKKFIRHNHCCQTRVARFFSVHHTKAEIYTKMTTIYTKWAHKIYEMAEE